MADQHKDRPNPAPFQLPPGWKMRSVHPLKPADSATRLGAARPAPASQAAPQTQPNPAATAPARPVAQPTPQPVNTPFVRQHIPFRQEPAPPSPAQAPVQRAAAPARTAPASNSGGLARLFNAPSQWKTKSKLLAVSAAAITVAALLFSFVRTIQPPAETDPAGPNTRSSQPVRGTGPAYKAPSETGKSSRARPAQPPAVEDTEDSSWAANELGLSPPLRDYKRISSAFGMRNHPIFGTDTHHDGLDVAARKGTPVYAVSDGVIEKQGRETGYGNTIRLNHPQAMQSMYAHLEKFADGMKQGTRVKQGDLIGYVGSTGWTTGPHLHFELRKNGVRFDPMKLANLFSAHTKPADNHAQAPRQASTPDQKKIESLMATSAAREGLHPQLMPALFGKESGHEQNGQLKLDAVSDRGASGLCQFTAQTFLEKLKKHGPRLGFAQQANQIDSSYSSKSGVTTYTAGDRILALRFDPSVAIPVCAAHIKDDLTYLQSRIDRPLTFTDSSLSHFTGRGVADKLLTALADPRDRKQPAYIYAEKINYDGATNMNVFFRDGNPKHPYTVEQVYNAKMRIMGTTPALSSQATRTPSAITTASISPSQ